MRRTLLAVTATLLAWQGDYWLCALCLWAAWSMRPYRIV